MNVEEIETAVAELPPEELSRFAKWFEEYRAAQWDREAKEDVALAQAIREGRQTERISRDDVFAELDSRA